MARVVGRANQPTGKGRRRHGVVALAAVFILIMLYVSMPIKQGQTTVPSSTDAGEQAPADAQPAKQKAAASAGGSSANGYKTGVFYFTGGEDNKPVEKHELLDEPVPEDCYMEEHADYDGNAIRWGLSHKLPSAAQCCQECKDLSQKQPDGSRCHIWVFCGSPTGECWSPDIWNHTTGECWLKYQEGWDGNPDRSQTNLVVNKRGAYPPEFRQEHKTAPEMVAWVAGVIPPS